MSCDACAVPSIALLAFTIFASSAITEDMVGIADVDGACDDTEDVAVMLALKSFTTSRVRNEVEQSTVELMNTVSNIVSKDHKKMRQLLQATPLDFGGVAVKEIVDEQDIIARGASIARKNFDAAYVISLLDELEQNKTARADINGRCFIPAAIQVALFLLLAAFLAVDAILFYRFGEHVHSTWCCCCIGFGHCVLSSHWQTWAFGLIHLVLVNSMYIYFCYTGVISKYLEQAGLVIYIAYIFLGGFALLFMELYYRYGKERVDEIRSLERKVDMLVSLFGTKTASVMDKADDVTDFLGLTEASSDDDITCAQTMQCKGPQKNPKGKPKLQREQMKKSLASKSSQP